MSAADETGFTEPVSNPGLIFCSAHFALIRLENACSHFLFLYGLNSRSDWALQPCVAARLEEGHL